MDFPLELQAGRTYPLWVTVHIPPNAQPGSYRGTIEVSTGRRQLARAEFRLKVVEASVPEERSLKVTNWFSLDDTPYPSCCVKCQTTSEPLRLCTPLGMMALVVVRD